MRFRGLLRLVVQPHSSASSRSGAPGKRGHGVGWGRARRGESPGASLSTGVLGGLGAASPRRAEIADGALSCRLCGNALYRSKGLQFSASGQPSLAGPRTAMQGSDSHCDGAACRANSSTARRAARAVAMGIRTRAARRRDTGTAAASAAG